MAFVALSFVQTADDVLRAREFIEKILYETLKEETRHGSPSIVAKFETGKGWRNRDFILDIAGLSQYGPAGQSGKLRTSLEWRRILYQEKLEKTLRQETTNRITQAACMLTESTGTKAIFAASASGRTARMISRLRPLVPIIGATHDLMNLRKMIISFGVFPICIGKVITTDSTDNMFKIFKDAVLEHGYLGEFFGQNVTLIFTAGTPLQTPGTTNLVQIKRI